MCPSTLNRSICKKAKMHDFQRVIFVHYHEIGLKGHNRSNFEKCLQRNIKSLLKGEPIASIERITGRIVIFLEEHISYEEALRIARFVARIPGVARTSSGFKCTRDYDQMKLISVRALEEAQPFTSFKVQAKRSFTDFPICSMDMNKEIGAVLCEAFPDATVLMKDPDVIVRVEVIQNSSYIFAFSIRGVGGLPVGSSGTIVCLLSSGIDSPVALWKMARRGARCIGVHFSGRPQTSDASEYLVDDIAHVLEQTGCIEKTYTIPLGDRQREIALSCPPPLRIILYRRLMFKIAEAIAHREHALALATGESLGQVASQTLDNIACTNEAVSLPVLRPLIGTDKLEIIEMAHELGTFEISSEDAPDCCTLFMPRSPETHAKLPAVLEAESAYPEDAWIEELIDAADIRSYRSH